MKIYLFLIFLLGLAPLNCPAETILNASNSFIIAKAVKLGRGKTSISQPIGNFGENSEISSCPEGCLTCPKSMYSPNHCASCKAGYYLMPQKVYSTCVKCPDTCKTCQYSGSVSCTSCKDGHSPVTGSGGKICIPSENVDANCLFYSSNGECANCATGYAANPDTGKCEPCKEGCSSCTFDVVTSCTKGYNECPGSGLVGSYRMKCTAIKDGYFAPDSVSLRYLPHFDSESPSYAAVWGYLSKCNERCKTCGQYNSNNSSYSGGQCGGDCADGYEFIGKVCMKSDEKIANCKEYSINNNEIKCSTCNSGYAVNPDTGKCEKCWAGCGSCEFDTVTSCTKGAVNCPANIVNSKRMVCNVIDGYYWNSVSTGYTLTFKNSTGVAYSAPKKCQRRCKTCNLYNEWTPSASGGMCGGDCASGYILKNNICMKSYEFIENCANLYYDSSKDAVLCRACSTGIPLTQAFSAEAYEETDSVFKPTLCPQGYGYTDGDYKSRNPGNPCNCTPCKSGSNLSTGYCNCPAGTKSTGRGGCQ